MDVTESSVLVLNQNYDPLNVCNGRRAFVLLHRGKAEVLEHGVGVVRTATRSYPLPSVIRLAYLIRRPRPQPRLSRREVFLRDRYTCQYCGKETRELTLDHVIPRHKGGKHVWENLVSACKVCNHKKANRTPAEANMTLVRPPKATYTTIHHLLASHLPDREAWLKFIPEWELERTAS